MALRRGPRLTLNLWLITSVRSIVEQIQLVSWFGGGYFVVIELQGAAERGFLEDRHGQYL